MGNTEKALNLAVGLLATITMATETLSRASAVINRARTEGREINDQELIILGAQVDAAHNTLVARLRDETTSRPPRPNLNV